MVGVARLGEKPASAGEPTSGEAGAFFLRGGAAAKLGDSDMPRTGRALWLRDGTPYGGAPDSCS